MNREVIVNGDADRVLPVEESARALVDRAGWAAAESVGLENASAQPVDSAGAARSGGRE